MTKAKQARHRRDMEPADWQESHSPTVPVTLTIDHGGGSRQRRTKEQGRRRKPDALLWNSLEADLEWAADRIARAFVHITSGLSVRAMDYSRDRVSGGGGDDDSDHAIDLQRDYLAWTRAATEAGINVSDIMQFLAHNVSLNDIDRDRRQRNGTAKDNLIRGLEEYLRMKGRLKR